MNYVVYKARLDDSVDSNRKKELLELKNMNAAKIAMLIVESTD